MSDVENGGNDWKMKFQKMAEGPFFNFSKPYLDFIGREKLFGMVYILMAVISLIIPFAILYKVIDSGFFSFGAKYVFAFLFTWLAVLFACWIGFQLWCDRLKKAATSGSSKFIAITNFSEILQTFGEWLGTLIGIIGAGGGLTASVFLGSDLNYLFSIIGLGFMNFGVAVIIIGPIVGFFIIIFSRFVAEQLRLLAALADNTKEIAANIKKSAKGT